MTPRSTLVFAFVATVFVAGCGKSARSPDAVKGALRSELERAGWPTHDNALGKNPEWLVCEPARGEYAFKVSREVGGDRVAVSVRQGPKEAATVDVGIHEVLARIGGKSTNADAKAVHTNVVKVDRGDPL